MKIIVFESVVLGRHAYGKGKHDVPRPEALILIQKNLAKAPGPKVTDVKVKRTVDKPVKKLEEKEQPKRTINEVVNRSGDSPSVKRRKRSRSKNASPRKPRK